MRYIIAGPVNILTLATSSAIRTHQVAGTMCFVKRSIKLLIMLKHFIFLIVFNMTAHHNDRLSHQEHKKPRSNASNKIVMPQENTIFDRSDV
jgi:hypothetical protein